MSIIDDFASISADLTKLEQAKMPEVKPDFSTDTGDVTDEARKALHAMYGIPMGGGIDDMALCFRMAPGETLNISKPVTIHVSAACQETFRRSQRQIAEAVSRAIKACGNSSRPSWL